ncbi:NADH dehydrogenase [ubiquinone] 1 beta subcomplex subunit 9 [Smittium culicis]|uniref:NADH dehydrogenase [ubiquinone] 1 beta subcomplex subunit 9 n=1 Tax=Smittium culicis TaxID=133412 RepID=A0A1R1Y7L3_9FUNG|nr:NADH dehydrogenase [ubiquinone] 1 beta subcomplex subunit 9 [Smittium culicis]
MSLPAHTRHVQKLYKQSLQAAQNWYTSSEKFRPVALAIRRHFEQNRYEASPVRLQELIRETEEYIEKFRHPLPYRYPTAVDGSKYERNMWYEKNQTPPEHFD